MTIKAKPAFQSALDDDADASLIQPSHWNAGFDLSLDGPTKLIGKAASGNGAAEEIDYGTWFKVESGILKPKVRRSAVRKGSDGASANYSTGVNLMAFDTVISDDESLWNSANNRFIVPAGVSWVQLHTVIQFTTSVTANSGFYMGFYKNGLNTYAPTSNVQVGSGGTYTNPRFALTSPPLDVVEGDYFDVRFQLSDSAAALAQNSNFIMQLLG